MTLKKHAANFAANSVFSERNRGTRSLCFSATAAKELPPTIQHMHGEVHANHVLYKRGAEPPAYRQIAVVEWSEQFQVRIFGGTVVQLNPKFIAETSDAEVHLRTTLKEALAGGPDNLW